MPLAAWKSREVDPLIAPLRDNQFLVDLVAQISGASQSEVEAQFVREHFDLGVTVREELARLDIAPHVWSESLEQFYASTNAFLYETIVWNRSPLKNNMRHWIGEYLSDASPQPQRVLTYGDGLGIDSYYLAQLGHDVTYFDVSKKCREFARRIFGEGNLEVQMIEDSCEVGKEEFDAVVCLDVLEHAPDPESLVDWLARRLRIGGKMLVHAPFFFVHRGVQTHLESNRRFCGQVASLYGHCGLTPIDGRVFWNPIVLERSSPNLAKKPRSMPWKVVLGSLLFLPGRYWSFPYEAVGKAMMKKNRLAELVSGLSHNDAQARSAEVRQRH